MLLTASTDLIIDDISGLVIASILLPTMMAFLVGLLISPPIIKLLNRHQLWRKKPIVKTIDGRDATITRKLNQDDQRKVPRFGGTTIVFATLFTAAIALGLSWLFGNEITQEMNFVSRSQTWLPLFALTGGFLLGALDDLITVDKLKLPKLVRRYIGGGLSLTTRILVVGLVGVLCGLWFYFKLGVSSVDVPFSVNDIEIGFLIIPFIILVMVATYSGSVIDGIDGLAGGVFGSIFLAYSAISFFQGLFDLATFCLVVAGSIYSFLWFNIPPARYYMSETGVMALTLSLSIVAFITDTVFLLPLIALPLCLTTLSVILQLLSKKFLKRKLLLVSPLHNYFRALGWQSETVTMRYWVISQVLALSGVAIFLLSY